MDAFRVDFKGLPGFTEAMRRAPRRLNDELLVAGRRIAFAGSGLAHKYVPRWQGHLANTIYQRAEQRGEGIVAMWGASADYALPVEKGRRPGAPMPPEGALLPWMGSHGIPASAEFVVRRSIARRGIPPRPFVGRAFGELKSRDFYRAEFRAAIRRVLAALR